ncbi:retroviral-like aspartic protease family protein [Pontibacter silvestris]|uniref:Retroviral-like aspartic protease family protein n=1 Tax=Pontibacter silvestris TaxID=2305183 RepID=A0ABW4WWW1_9BACT|nr:retroviral-like aspartic protease family protein [Pontibacter silvestris]MCC9136827.1 aspartyl protease family protein [Pontibacter silvestris]
MINRTPYSLILWSLTILFALSRTAIAVPVNSLPEEIKVPFELKGGLIFIKVQVNNKPANFILDTGAPTLVISKRLATNATHTLDGKGVTGNIQVQQVVVPKLVLGDMQLSETPAIAMDLAHLEKLTKKQIDGLIGYSTLKDYELLLDYGSKTLTLFRANATDYHTHIKPTSEMPFKLQAHIPVVEATIGNQKMLFGLDTGAEANLLNIGSISKLNSNDYKKSNVRNISGANATAVAAQEAYVKATLINGHTYSNMQYVFSDISPLNQGYGLSIDGLLGYPFLSARKMSINFADSKVYFWD